MDINILAALAQQNPNYRVQGGHLYGQKNGYPFFLYNKLRGGGLLQFSLERPLITAEAREIKTTAAGFDCRVIRSNDKASVVLEVPDAVNFEALCTAMTDFFAARQLYAPSACPVCRRLQCDCAVMWGNRYVPAHRSCAEGRSIQTAQKAKANLESGSYALGILGAVLGAVVGTLPLLLFLFVLDSMVYLLWVLVPVGAYWGYKLLSGKMTTVAFVFILLAAVAAGVGAYLLFLYITISSEVPGLPFSFGLRALFANMDFSDWTAYIIKPILYSGFALLGTFFACKNGGRGAIQNSVNMLQTITPPGASSAAAAGYVAQMQPQAAAPQSAAYTAPVSPAGFADTASQVERDMEMRR